MNIKVAIGQIAKKIGVLSLALYIVKKLGFLTKFKDHHANGTDLKFDLESDGELYKINTVFDIGASIGSMTAEYLNIFPKASIHAFEPYLVSYKTLENRFGQNKKVILQNLALSDTPGTLTMYLKSDSGYNSLNDAVNKPDEKMDNMKQEVNITTIDDYCTEHGIAQIDFIKCDTEGLDLKVLKGAENLLKTRKIKYIFVECTFEMDNIQNSQFIDLHHYLAGFGFKTRAIYDQSNFGDKTYLTCVNALFYLQAQS